MRLLTGPGGLVRMGAVHMKVAAGCCLIVAERREHVFPLDLPLLPSCLVPAAGSQLTLALVGCTEGQRYGPRLGADWPSPCQPYSWQPLQQPSNQVPAWVLQLKPEAELLSNAAPAAAAAAAAEQRAAAPQDPAAAAASEAGMAAAQQALSPDLLILPAVQREDYSSEEEEQDPAPLRVRMLTSAAAAAAAASASRGHSPDTPPSPLSACRERRPPAAAAAAATAAVTATASPPLWVAAAADAAVAVVGSEALKPLELLFEGSVEVDGQPTHRRVYTDAKGAPLPSLPPRPARLACLPSLRATHTKS